MKKIISLLILILFAGCKTNPPTGPISLKTGEVQMNITFIEDNSINPLRTVLLEDFANVSCAPCVESNRIIQSTLQNNGNDKIVAIKFPTNFPSPSDPFYLSGKQFCDYRMNFYTIFYAPTIILDGISKPSATDSNAIQQALNIRLASPTDFKMTIEKSIINGGIRIDAELKVKNKNTLNLDDSFLRFAIIESDIEFTQAPGSNGETKFYDVLRVLFPSNEGIQLSSVNTSNFYQFFNSLDTLWNSNKLQVVAFIQDRVSKEVYQAVSTQ